MKLRGRWREWGVRPFPFPERHLVGNRKGKSKEKNQSKFLLFFILGKSSFPSSSMARWTCPPHWDLGCDRLTVSLLNLWELLLGIAFEPPVQAVPTGGPAHCRHWRCIFRTDSTLPEQAEEACSSQGLFYHHYKTWAMLYNRSHLTFILLCLIPSTICSIWRKNWSRAAGEAMALKEKPVEEWPEYRILRKREVQRS